ncbi:MAG: hypothetical protein ACUZ8H_03370, partial [Candidatus Anammoxibacter sp.]
KGSLPDFIEKLQEKHQSYSQQNQASHAVNLYYFLFRPIPKNNPSDFNDLNNSVKENNHDYNKRLPDKERPSISQIEPA